MSKTLDGIAAVVAIPGLWGSKEQFRGWERLCSKLHPVDPTRVGSDRGKDAADVMDQIVGNKVVIGHSLGALSAVRLAAREDVVAMVLVAPAGPWAFRNLGRWTLMRIWKYLVQILVDKQVLVSQEDAKTLLFNRFQKPGDHWTQLVPETGWTLLKAIVRPERAPCPKYPTLVVLGKADQMVPLRTQRKVAKRHTARVIELDLGHMIPLEDEGGEVWRAIERWVEEVTND